MLVGVPEKNSKAVFELAWSTYLEVGSGSGWQFWAAGRSCASLLDHLQVNRDKHLLPSLSAKVTFSLNQ